MNSENIAAVNGVHPLGEHVFSGLSQGGGEKSVAYRDHLSLPGSGRDQPGYGREE